jgi:hypothetical protein
MFLVSFQAFMIWLITWITKYTTPSRTTAMSNGKIVDTCAKLPQTHVHRIWLDFDCVRIGCTNTCTFVQNNYHQASSID